MTEREQHDIAYTSCLVRHIWMKFEWAHPYTGARNAGGVG